MARFAEEVVAHRGAVPAGQSVAVGFEAPSAGPIRVMLTAYAEETGGPQPGASSFEEQASIGQPRGAVAKAPVRSTPGGGADTPRPISPAAFGLELLDARGKLMARAQGSLQFEFIPPIDPRANRPTITVPGPVAARWTVRITNTTAFDARLDVHIAFRGHRPLVSRNIDLQFLNDKLDLILNGPQPFRLVFENRVVAEMPTGMGGAPVPIEHTFVNFKSTPEWARQYPALAGLDHDLGARAFSQGTASTDIRMRATVFDDCLAFGLSIAFPYSRGKIDVLAALQCANSAAVDAVSEFARFFTNATPLDAPEIDIRDFALDLLFILRPRGYRDRPGPTFEIVARPYADLSPGWVGTVLDAMLKHVFEHVLVDRVNGMLRGQAGDLLGWLLGNRDVEVTGATQSLALEYVETGSDRPQPIAPDSAPRAQPALIPGNLSKVDHVVVVMMENRSFDHMLGFLSLPASGNAGRNGLGRTDVDGLTGAESNPVNTRGDRQRVFPLIRDMPMTDVRAKTTRGTRFGFDPGHSYAATRTQRGDFDLTPANLPSGLGIFDDVTLDGSRLGRNEGFALDFGRSLSKDLPVRDRKLLRGEVMGYHPGEHVPIYRFLAEEYAVCDRWFAAHPGHTWPNRFVTLTGNLAPGPDGFPQIDNPPHVAGFDPLEVKTLFDHLTAGGVEWAYFEHDFSMIRLFSKYTFDRERVIGVDDPERGFYALARRGKLPPVSFVEPNLTDVPPGSDDHPPSDIADGQALIQRIYDALALGPVDQWSKTMLIITYDEHGGFFDHVFPESKTDARGQVTGDFCPIGFDPITRKPIDHYGMRVPALVVSPWIAPRSVAKEEFDHTAIIKTILTRFLPQSPPDMGGRVALSRDLGSLLTLREPRAPVRSPKRTASSRAAAPAKVATDAADDFRNFMGAARARFR